MVLETIRTRFYENAALHSGIDWALVEKRLLDAPEALEILRRMEESGGEPDTIGYDEKTGKLIFCDCAKESPSGRRSLCYDETKRLCEGAPKTRRQAVPNGKRKKSAFQ